MNPANGPARFTIPSIVWVLLIPLGIVVIIGGIILGFQAIATIEGVASIIMIIAGFFVFRGLATDNGQNGKSSDNQLFLGLAIGFYALMGMAIDQPGNFIFNKPVEMFFCPPGTAIYRDVDVNHYLPGETTITQNYQCFDSNGNIAKQIDMWPLIVIRFVEYVLMGYLLYFLGKLMISRKLRPQNPNSGQSHHGQ
ncbi:hypothetical protein IT411_02120 [Candidatus Peregrinibacteria bacterium]|nr:hypothetical protein [Candidatus Peregrinibacteria bacterium]